ncbi:MAG: right-handed parallel beta-helix repeat-containing protein [Cellulosilyticaceae bacterium]
MDDRLLEFYISLEGKDTNPGTLAAPFKSFWQALKVIKNSQHMVEKITFWIREGRYTLNQTLVFDEEIMTNQNLHIIFKSYPQEKVVITGGVELETQWETYKGEIKVCDIGKGYQFDQLLADNQVQILCRYPNYVKNEILNGYSAEALSKQRIASWANPKGGYIRALHHCDWGGNSYVIKGKTEDHELLYEWVGDNNRGSKHSPNKLLVENIFEELDAENEWYYNQETGKLFFYPSEGMNLKEMTFEAGQLEQLFVFKGSSSECPIAHITLEGLSFTNTHRTLFTQAYERPLRGDWGVVRAGAIYMENAEHICVKDCKFYDLGGNAIMMSGYNKDHIIDYCDFIDIGATGVLAVGLEKAVRDPSTWDGNNHKSIINDEGIGPKTQDYPREITISNNYIYNSGIYEKQSAGVCISIAECMHVVKNTIHHVPRAAINISDGTFGGHLIAGNDLFDCVRETGDHGPFNSWGRDRFWSMPEYDTMGHYGKVKRPYALLDARSTTIIRNNRIHANHAFGLDLDDGSTNYAIYNNLCLGVGIKTREGFDRQVYNNVLIGCCFEVHCTYADNQDQFYNNIVYNHKAYNFIAVNKGATTCFENNCYWNDGKVVEGLDATDTTYVIQDPKFNNPAKNDYTVSQESIALAQGFINFPMGDEVFGRVDKPNAPLFVYLNKQGVEDYAIIKKGKFSDVTSEGLRSAAGLPDYKGTYMVEIPTIGGWVEEGYRQSDVIRKINGQEIAHTQDFIKYYEVIEEGNNYEVEIYRNQTPITLKVVKIHIQHE